MPDNKTAGVEAAQTTIDDSTPRTTTQQRLVRQAPELKAGERYATLAERLQAISQELPGITKGGHNDAQNYDFVRQEDVMNAVRPLLIKHGVIVMPRVVGHHLHSKTGVGRDGVTEVSKGSKTIVDMTFTFINVDNPDDKLEISWTAEGDDYGDKGTNKATTIAQKNMYIRLFNIADEDPDAITPEGGTVAAPGKTVTPQKITTINTMLRRLKISPQQYELQLKKPIEKLTNAEADDVIARMQANISRQVAEEEAEVNSGSV